MALQRGSCKTCIHSLRTVQLGGEGLFCHADPPQLVIMPAPPPRAGDPPGISMHGLWPPVDYGDYCAKHEAVPEIPERPRERKFGEIQL